MRISDWSSDVCSSDLAPAAFPSRRQTCRCYSAETSLLSARERSAQRLSWPGLDQIAVLRLARQEPASAVSAVGRDFRPHVQLELPSEPAPKAYQEAPATDDFARRPYEQGRVPQRAPHFAAD